MKNIHASAGATLSSRLCGAGCCVVLIRASLKLVYVSQHSLADTIHNVYGLILPAHFQRGHFIKKK